MGRKRGSGMTRQKSQSIDHQGILEFQQNLKLRLESWKNYVIIDEPLVENISNDLFNVNNDQITFPMGLSSAYRRYIHLIATDLQLFHCSIGQNETRQIIVSRKLPIITPSEQITTIPPSSFKPNIIHQYFELDDAEKSYRQSLLGIGLTSQQLLELQQRLIRERSPNISKIINSNSNYIYHHEDLSEAIGADFNPHTSNATFIHVTTVHELEEICTILSHPLNNEIAFDLEMNNNFVFHGCTCLIQISCKTTERFVCGHDLSLENQYVEDESDIESVITTTHDWYELDIFIDPMFLPWKDISRSLLPIFSDASIVKVCHGARNGDVKALYRDFGIVIVNGFDTQEAFKYLGEQHLGLAEILMKMRAPGSGWEVTNGTIREILRTNSADQVEEDYNTIKQRLSQADWTQRPLPADMIRYGRMDVRFLIPLYHILVRRLYETPSSFSLSESMEIDAKEITDLNSSTNSLTSDLDVNLRIDHVLSQYSFSFSEQASPNSIKQDSIDHIFSLTLSNSSELWTPTIPDIEDKTTPIRISILKNKYESFRRKSKSKHWSDLHTHVFMRLVQWRERVGYIVNESPAYVCPTSLLLMIATKLPKSVEELHIMYSPLPQYVQPELISENGIENILTIIQGSIEEYHNSKEKPAITKSNIVVPESNVAMEISPPVSSTVEHHPTANSTLKVQEISDLLLSTPFADSRMSRVESNECQSKNPTINNSHSLTSNTLPRFSLFRVFGMVVAVRIFGYFIGIPPLPFVKNLFPSFFSWSLRLRANMKRL